MTRGYAPAELRRFLEAVDRHLSSSERLVLIGGAAAALAYGVRRATTDIDTIDDVSRLESALRTARSDTGLCIPVETVGVYDAPYEYESRLRSVELGLANLDIVVPERHDLVLMKTVRGEANDREAIREIADREGLDRTILVERYKSEMGHVVLNHRFLRLNFLAVIEELYGAEIAEVIASEIGVKS